MLTFLNSGGTVNYASNGVGVTDTQIGYFAGLRVVVDSQVPTVDPDGATTGDAFGYTCYLAAPGVIRTGLPVPSDDQAERRHPVPPRRDVGDLQPTRPRSWTSYTGDMHPENTDLADADNWTLAYTSRENVPLVELIVNTPYGQVK